MSFDFASMLASARRLAVFGLLTACLGCAGTHARPQDKQAKDPPKEAPRKVAGKPAMPVIAEDQFDQMVFRQERNAEAGRKKLVSQLVLQTDDVDRACKLSAEQKRKLHLAGRGDIKRFFDSYEELREKYRLGQHDPQNVQNIWQGIRPLQASLLGGLFQADSLFNKALASTLTPEQLQHYEAIQQERRTFRHRAAIQLAVATIEEGLPLRDDQRRELIALMLSQTKPLRRPGPYETYLILAQVGRIPEEKLKPLFDNAQWRGIERMVTQYQQTEQSLRHSGLVVEEEEGR